MPAADPVPAFAGGWGHAHGLFKLRVPAMPSDLAGMIDHRAIVDVITCHAWSVDERQWDVMADIYTDGLTTSGCIAGVTNMDTIRGKAVFIDWLKGFLDTRSDQLRHNFLNIVVTEQGSREATAIGYCILTSTSPAGATLRSTGIYRFSLVKQGSRWRLSAIYSGLDTSF